MADSNVLISKKNEVYAKLTCEKHILKEISDHFTFFVPGYTFVPSYRNKIWDGKIRLLNLQTQQIYLGLLPHLEAFLKSAEYTFEYDETRPDIEDEYSLYHAGKFIQSLNLHSHDKPIEPRKHQIVGFCHAIQKRRALLLSPTASGKSLIIYLMFRQFLDYQNLKGLIIVPNTSLVEQLYSDFEDYSSVNGFNVENNVHRIYQGKEKESDKKLLISTWQSLYKEDENYFSQFDYVIADECLHPDTLVTTEYGHIKISKICIGDLVLTMNEYTKIYEYKPVIKVHKNLSVKEKKFKITYDDGTYIIITGNHKQYTQRGWIRTDELTIDDVVLSYDKELKSKQVKNGLEKNRKN